MASIDPSEKLDGDVEEVMLDLADEFIESVVTFACKAAKHRKSDVLGVEDVKLVLENEWSIRVMGFSDARDDHHHRGGPASRRGAKEGTREYKHKLQAINNAKALH